MYIHIYQHIQLYCMHYTVHTYSYTHILHMHTVHTYTHIQYTYALISYIIPIQIVVQQIVHPYISIVLYSPSSIYHYLICYYLIYTTYYIYPCYMLMLIYIIPYIAYCNIHSCYIQSCYICHTQDAYKYIDIWGINRPNIIQRFNIPP